MSIESSPEFILSVKDLHVEFDTYGGVVKAVRGANFGLRKGKTLAIVGESGCGKSVSMQAIMGLIPMPPGRITSGSVVYQGKEVLGEALKSRNKIRGQEMGMIFQDPMTSLNPTMTLGKQITETLKVHFNYSKKQAHAKAIQLLKDVQIPEAEKRVDQYPFQFSGGMRQRAMIAMALACDPKILIADEPTTALDVTIQAQILQLLKKLQQDRGMSIILITHDLGVVARMADDVSVMYAGQVVESGTVEDIFYKPSHPYTLGLKNAMPTHDQDKSAKLIPIEGAPPDLFSPPKGCSYFDRCPYAMKICEKNEPLVWNISDVQKSRCWLHDDRAIQSPVRHSVEKGASQ